MPDEARQPLVTGPAGPLIAAPALAGGIASAPPAAPRLQQRCAQHPPVHYPAQQQPQPQFHCHQQPQPHGHHCPDLRQPRQVHWAPSQTLLTHTEQVPGVPSSTYPGAVGYHVHPVNAPLILVTDSACAATDPGDDPTIHYVMTVVGCLVLPLLLPISWFMSRGAPWQHTMVRRAGRLNCVLCVAWTVLVVGATITVLLLTL